MKLNYQWVYQTLLKTKWIHKVELANKSNNFFNRKEVTHGKVEYSDGQI